MSRAVAAAVIAGLVLVGAARSEAQTWEASFLAGYTPDASLDRRAPEFDALDIRGGFTWGGSVSRSLGRRWGAEVLWMEQQSGLQLGVEDGSPTLFEFTVGDLHGNAVYHFADHDARLTAYGQDAVVQSAALRHFYRTGLRCYAQALGHAGFGAHFAEVAADLETGEVRVRRMLGVFP